MQRKQLYAKIKKILNYEVIIFVSVMLIQSYIKQSFCILFVAWALVALGFNLKITWFIHQHGNDIFDKFFIHYSWMGEWLLIVSVGLALISVNWKIGLSMLITLGLQAVAVALIKAGINSPRPIEINFTQIRIIPNNVLYHWQGFPSGHTAVGFFTMGMFAIFLQQYPKFSKPYLPSLLSILALTMGYSRIYLGQHSLIDVCAGGTLALIFLTLVMWLMNKRGWHEQN